MQILQPCGEAMTATSRLLIVEAVLAQRGAELPPHRHGPAHAGALGARGHTAAEFGDLVGVGGLTVQRIIPPARRRFTVIEAQLI